MFRWRWSVGCNTASMGIHGIRAHGVPQFHLRRSRRSRRNAAMAATATSLPPGAPEESLDDGELKKAKKEARKSSEKRSEFKSSKKVFCRFQMKG